MEIQKNDLIELINHLTIAGCWTSKSGQHMLHEFRFAIAE